MLPLRTTFSIISYLLSQLFSYSRLVLPPGAFFASQSFVFFRFGFRGSQLLFAHQPAFCLRHIPDAGLAPQLFRACRLQAAPAAPGCEPCSLCDCPSSARLWIMQTGNACHAAVCSPSTPLPFCPVRSSPAPHATCSAISQLLAAGHLWTCPDPDALHSALTHPAPVNYPFSPDSPFSCWIEAILFR